MCLVLRPPQVVTHSCLHPSFRNQVLSDIILNVTSPKTEHHGKTAFCMCLAFTSRLVRALFRRSPGVVHGICVMILIPERSGILPDIAGASCGVPQFVLLCARGPVHATPDVNRGMQPVYEHGVLEHTGAHAFRPQCWSARFDEG